MEKIKNYLTVDGWKADYNRTKNDFSIAGSKVKDFAADENGSVNTNAALIAGGLAAAVLGAGLYSGVENYAGRGGNIVDSVVKPIGVCLDGIIHPGNQSVLHMIPGAIETAGLAAAGVGTTMAINESDMDPNTREALKGMGLLMASAGTYYLYAKGFTQGQIDNIIDLGTSVPNYVSPRLNASGLTWLNGAALVGCGAGLVKIIKGMCGKYTPSQ